MLGIELLMGPKGATITYDSSSMSGCREIAKFLVKKLDKKHPTSGAPGPSGPLFNIFTPGVTSALDLGPSASRIVVSTSIKWAWGPTNTS